jgi:hypothetical protein
MSFIFRCRWCDTVYPDFTDEVVEKNGIGLECALTADILIMMMMMNQVSSFNKIAFSSQFPNAIPQKRPFNKQLYSAKPCAGVENNALS